MDGNVEEVVKKLVDDHSPQVRRECAIALRHLKSDHKAELWSQLAGQLPSHDRWYLEALGIAANGDWDNCLTTFAATKTNKRSERRPDYLAKSCH